MKNPDPKLLVRIAIADAYAAAVEYVKLPRDRDTLDECLHFKRYVKHPTLDHRAGCYTDDTEMSAANVHVLLEHPAPYMRLMFADAYVRQFRHGGRRKGYSRLFQSFLELTHDGWQFLKEIRPDSVKNGAAMRAVPFGVLPTIEEVLEAATVQASVTHDTPEGRFSARAIALMSHFSLYEVRPLYNAAAYCLTYLPKEDRRFQQIFMEDWPGGPVTGTPAASVAITTVHAVTTLVRREPSLMAMLERTIRWGGDTDSVAAIAWGIASPRFQGEVLPDFMERHLERRDSRTGTSYLLDLGTRLMAKFS
ncbi:ADP-ribosylglycohydrolase family protein [Candidatus Uhrbacteria bacterium]|nr:ADP-ribosylglycohydrolase family protein [Candidatus Uhrbacteria bacterium]